MNTKILFFMAAFLMSHTISWAAELKLPAIIGDHMVLQQQSAVRIWGWAKAGAKVTVKAGWLNKPVIVNVGKTGGWLAMINTPKAGGPYEVSVSADTVISFKDILIGEVWVCSGQSNMQMPFNGYVSQPVNGANDYVAHSSNNNIRLFNVQRKFSATPLDDCVGKWSVSNPADVANFSAVAYVYGKYLQDVLNVPVGLILSTWGGTPAEAWTDKQTLESNFKEINLSVLETDKFNHQSPSTLFNAMINPLLNYTMKGVIWYQGESNRKDPALYSRLFPALIKNWRERWVQGEFPFYFVQIAPYRYDSLVNTELIREVQLNTYLKTPNTGMAVTMDIGDYNTIHPAEKIIVGKRLAYWSLAKTYGINGIAYAGPDFKEMKVEGKQAKLSFNYAENGLSTFGKPLDGFTIAGSDKKFYPAEAKIVGKEVVLTSDKVDTPVAVRYCWKNYADGSLYNTSGLPASSFRTDSW